MSLVPALNVVELTIVVVEKAVSILQNIKENQQAADEATNLLTVSTIYLKNLKDVHTHLKENPDEDISQIMDFLESDKKLFQSIVDKVEGLKEKKWWDALKSKKQELREHEVQVHRHIEILMMIMMKEIWDKNKKQTHEVIQGKEAQVFWYKYIGYGTHEVSVNSFSESLQIYLTEKYKLAKIDGLTNIVANVCDLDADKQITLHEYAMFVARFGPMHLLLKKSSAVMTADGKLQPWYMPNTSREDVEKGFNEKKFTYCIRFSADPRKHFALSYVRNDGKHQHMLIRNHPTHGLSILMKDRKYYATLIELLQNVPDRPAEMKKIPNDMKILESKIKKVTNSTYSSYYSDDYSGLLDEEDECNDAKSSATDVLAKPETVVESKKTSGNKKRCPIQ